MISPVQVFRLAAALALFGGPVATPVPASEADSAGRFADARVGLFVDWGLFTLIGKDPGVMKRDRLPAAEYEKLPPRFQPNAFRAEDWVQAAEDAGARYLVVTAKGPDGFCLFDSALTGFDAVEATPYAKDPLAALAEACKKRRLPLGVVYSLRDWHHPDAGRRTAEERGRYAAYVSGQVTELCTRYGPLAAVWFEADDTPGIDVADLCRLVRARQPSALAGVRFVGGRPPAKTEADVIAYLPEEGLKDEDAPPELPPPTPPTPLGEVVWALPTAAPALTGSDPKGRSRDATVALVRAVATAAGRGQNLRLGVVARADGSIAPDDLTRLKGLGQWLHSNGASVYGTRRGPLLPQPWGVSTQKERPNAGPGQIFLHVFHPEGPIVLPNAALSLNARLLGGTTPLSVTRADGKGVIDLPDEGRDPADTVVVLSAQAPDPARVRERLR